MLMLHAGKMYVMKKNGLLFLLVFVSALSLGRLSAQPFTTLSQNFDVACATSVGFPSYWLTYNPLPSTMPDGEWHCTPTNGRPNASSMPTPGVQCTGVWASTFHLDTSYLITPRLDLTSYTQAYLRFDTKADSISLTGARLAILITTDTGMVSTFIYVDSTTSISPVFGPMDGLGWVTHELNLLPYTGSTSSTFYIAFRYTSGTTGGSQWYLDNVNISTTSMTLGTQSINKENLSLNALGQGSSSRISLSFSACPGSYQLALYDMMGRQVYEEMLSVREGDNTHIIDGLNLTQGMYLVKMGNNYTYGTAKVIVQ